MAENLSSSPMKRVSAAAVAAVALLHVWFFVLETFLWETPLAQASLGMSAAEAEATAVLAANQGVYNAVFAAGLVCALVAKDEKVARSFRHFFLWAVILVGIYGAASARIVVLFIQTIPAVMALALSWAATRPR